MLEIPAGTDGVAEQWVHVVEAQGFPLLAHLETDWLLAVVGRGEQLLEVRGRREEVGRTLIRVEIFFLEETHIIYVKVSLRRHPLGAWLISPQEEIVLHLKAHQPLEWALLRKHFFDFLLFLSRLFSWGYWVHLKV